MGNHMYSTINDELHRIVYSGKGNGAYHYQAIIHVMDTDTSYEALKMVSLDINRDYETNIADEITVQVLLSPGIYADKIHPYASNLEISIIRSHGMYNYNSTVRRYRAYLKKPVDIRKRSPMMNGVPSQNLNQMDVFKIEFQLVPLLVEKLLTIQCGTNFTNDITVGDALSTMLMNESSLIEDLPDQERLQGVDMVPPDNESTYQNLPIPHATKLVNLPNYLQKHSYGVYQQGMGHYIQDATWYVFPRFRVKREDSSIRYLNIFVSPRDKLRYAESTYRVEGEDVFIIGTVEGETNNNRAAQILNDGNGVRMTNLELVGTRDNVDVRDNMALVSRGNTLSEFKLMDAPNGNDYAPISSNPMSANVFEQVAKVEGRLGKLYAINWHNANHDIIKPGMVVRLHTLDENADEVVTEGILLKAHHYISMNSEGINSMSYSAVCGLFVFCREDV